MEGQKPDGNGNVQPSVRRLPITTAFLLLPPVAFGQGRQRQQIRDPAYPTIGTITTRTDGVREARDRNYSLVSRGDSLSAFVPHPDARTAE